MPEYSNSSIYKLCHRNPIVKDCYIGSTTNFARRRYAHKSYATCDEKGNGNVIVYQFIKATGGWENWDMVELENYSATDKKDLHRREREWIEKEKATLNMRRPILTPEEYREICNAAAKRWKKENPEKNRAMVKKWKQENREKYNAYQQQKCICPCGVITARNHMGRHRKSQFHQDWVKDNEVPDLQIYKNCFVVCE